MKRLAVLLALLMMLFAVGCGGGKQVPLTKEVYDSIKLGMKYAEVVKIMGKDGAKETKGDDTVYRWAEKDGTGRELEVRIDNKSGKVMGKRGSNLY